MGQLFPFFVDLNNQKCLVVGGGRVAARKAVSLFDYGAAVTVVSPELSEELTSLQETGLIECHLREFEENDLENVFLVFIATNNNRVNQEIAARCRTKGILVNVVDDPPNCDFYVPAVVKRGPLVVAVSTGGNSPMLARRLREELEGIIGEEYGDFAEILGELRLEVKEKVPDISKRTEIFKNLVYSDILDLLRAGEKEKVRERIEACMSSWQV